VLTNQLAETNAYKLYTYPNPTHNDFFIYGLNEETSYKIINNVGQQIQSGITNPNTKIEVHSLQKGIYYVVANQQIFKLILN